MQGAFLEALLTTYQFPRRCGCKPTEAFQDCRLMGPVMWF